MVHVLRSTPPFDSFLSSYFRNSNEVHRLCRVWFLSVAIPLFAFTLPVSGQTPSSTISVSPRNESRYSSGAKHEDNRSFADTVSVRTLRVPKKALSHLEAAQKQFEKRQLTQAMVEIERAIEIYPSFPQAFCMKALIQLAQRDFTEAAENAAHAISLDAGDAYLWVALATAFNSLGEWPEAEAAAGRALDLDSLVWQGRLELAKSYYGEGKFNPALQVLDRVSGDFPDVHLVRGNILMKVDRWQEALREFSLFLQETPEDPRAVQIQRILLRLQLPPN